MPKYRITDQYLKKVWFEKIVELEAKNEEQATEKYQEGDEDEDFKVVSDQEVESEYDWSEIQDIEELS